MCLGRFLTTPESSFRYYANDLKCSCVDLSSEGNFISFVLAAAAKCSGIPVSGIETFIFAFRNRTLGAMEPYG